MIKLKDILKEEKTFKAKSKETGRVVVYKSKDAMDKAIKDKRAEPLDKKKTTTKGASLFKKDVQKKKTDTNVDASLGKVYDDDGEEITLSPKDQKIVNKHKAGQITDEELRNAGYSEFRGTYFTREPKPSKEVPKVSNVKVSKEDVKRVSDLSNEIEKNIDDAYGDLDSDERDDFVITLENVGTTLEDKIDYDDLSDEDRKEFDEIFGEIEEQVSHLQNDELGMGSIEGDPREVSKRALAFIKKFSTKNEGVIKLTDLIKENKRKDLLKVSTTIGRRPSDVNKFLKKYKLDADDLLDVLDAGSSSQRRRYSMAIIAAMRGSRRALRDLDNLLGFL